MVLLIYSSYLFNGSHTVCNDKDCLSFYQPRNCFLDLCLIVHIKCTGDGKTLAFTTRKCGTVFSDHGLVAVWQFFNKCMTACRLCSSDHFPQTSAGICAKISLTTLSYSATILSTLPHSRHNNPGEKVQYSTKRNRACKQQYQFQKITKPINKKMIVSDAKSSPNIGKYLIFSPLSNLFQFFHNKSKQLCLFPPSQKTDRHKMPLSTVPSQNFHLQNKYHFLHCLYETKSALFQPIENQHC